MLKKLLVTASVLVLAGWPVIGLGRIQSAVITSAYIKNGIMYVEWNQLAAIPEKYCMAEFTPDMNWYYSPVQPDYDCSTTGQKSAQVDVSYFLANYPSDTFYTTIVNNVTGYFMSDFVMVQGEPGFSHSPPQTPPVRVPLSSIKQ